MNVKNKIGLVIAVVLIIGAIWYLQSLQAHPEQSTNAGPTQMIGIGAGTETSTIADSSSTVGAATGTTPLVADAIRMISAGDQKAGYHPAIEIADPTGFVNASSSFRLKDLIGKKVILLDFWTYSCINCIRTLPYLTAWYNKYKDDGLVIVGIHTPEFDFEKDINNVRAAAQKYGIDYPVVLDSNYGTWNAYGNLYWPHEYLIDLAGYIVHDHVGEGGYDETEAMIQKLLEERSVALGARTVMPTSTVSIAPDNLLAIGSPETYFGAARNQYLANGTEGIVGTQTLMEPSSISTNALYLAGTWDFSDQYATNASAGAKIIFKYRSAKVFFVASAPTPVSVEVLQDGKPVGASAAGSDVKNGTVTIGQSRLYNVIANPDGAGVHTLELIIQSPGLQAFTFTFG